MRKIGFLLVGLVLIGFNVTAVAGGAKNDIMHCGCVYVADEGSLTNGTASMEWTALTVKNGKGHRNHVVNHLDDCLSGYDPMYCTDTDVANSVPGCTSTADVIGYDPLFTTFVRDNDDCVVAGNVGGLDLCDDTLTTDVDETPVEGDDCGTELSE